MAIVLGIDLETTGLDPQTDSIIEIGFILWDTESCGILKCFSSLIVPNFAIPAEITALTGIDQHATAQSLNSALTFLHKCAEPADYFVAHNADFEKSFLRASGYGFPLRWIDTKTDLPYPPMKGQGDLSSISMGHGLFNPMPHRALTDTLVMLQLLSKYDFAEVERYAQAATVWIGAFFDYEENTVQTIRKRGYHFIKEGKFWRKPFKDFNVNAELEALAALGIQGRILEKEEN